MNQEQQGRQMNDLVDKTILPLVGLTLLTLAFGWGALLLIVGVSLFFEGWQIIRSCTPEPRDVMFVDVLIRSLGFMLVALGGAMTLSGCCLL